MDCEGGQKSPCLSYASNQNGLDWFWKSHYCWTGLIMVLPDQHSKWILRYNEEVLVLLGVLWRTWRLPCKYCEIKNLKPIRIIFFFINSFITINLNVISVPDGLFDFWRLWPNRRISLDSWWWKKSYIHSKFYFY